MIAFDNAVDGGSGSGGISWFHTCSTDPYRVLLVAALGDDAASSGISAVTYGGISLTFWDSIRIGNTSGRWIELWYMQAPATGTNTVAISASGLSAGASASYTGAAQEFTPLMWGNKAQNNGTSLSVPLTTLDNTKYWAVCAEGNDQGVPGADGILTLGRAENIGYGLFDSNHGITPAQTYTVTTSIPSVGNEGMVCAILAPEPIEDPLIGGQFNRHVIGLNL